MKELTVRVFRFDPEQDREGHFETYTVKVNEGARVLHVLHAIHDGIDPSLSYRYSCASGQCGSCAVRVNGEPVLACMEEAGDGITIEPLNLAVKKDLVTDLVPRLEEIAYLLPKKETVLPKKADIDAMKPLRDCIECLCCVSVCPAVDVTTFLGPTAMRQEMRLVLDPRDSGDRIQTRYETDFSPAPAARPAGRSARRRSRSRERRSRNSGHTRTRRGSPCPVTGKWRHSSGRPDGVFPGPRNRSLKEWAKSSSRTAR